MGVICNIDYTESLICFSYLSMLHNVCFLYNESHCKMKHCLYYKKKTQLLAKNKINKRPLMAVRFLGQLLKYVLKQQQ